MGMIKAKCLFDVKVGAKHRLVRITTTLRSCRRFGFPSWLTLSAVPAWAHSTAARSVPEERRTGTPARETLAVLWQWARSLTAIMSWWASPATGWSAAGRGSMGYTPKYHSTGSGYSPTWSLQSFVVNDISLYLYVTSFLESKYISDSPISYFGIESILNIDNTVLVRVHHVEQILVLLLRYLHLHDSLNGILEFFLAVKKLHFYNEHSWSLLMNHPTFFLPKCCSKSSKYVKKFLRRLNFWAVLVSAFKW